MEPLYPKGSLSWIDTKVEPDELQVGDVVVARTKVGNLIMHTAIMRKHAVPIWKYNFAASTRINPITGKKEVQPYKHATLGMLASQAFAEGKEFFSYRKIGDGEIEACENEYDHCKVTVKVPANFLFKVPQRTIYEAHDKEQVMEAVKTANELGLNEGVDYFSADNCIFFFPLDDEIVKKIIQANFMTRNCKDAAFLE